MILDWHITRRTQPDPQFSGGGGRRAFGPSFFAWSPLFLDQPQVSTALRGDLARQVLLIQVEILLGFDHPLLWLRIKDLRFRFLHESSTALDHQRMSRSSGADHSDYRHPHRYDGHNANRNPFSHPGEARRGRLRSSRLAFGPFLRLWIVEFGPVEVMQLWRAVPLLLDAVSDVIEAHEISSASVIRGHPTLAPFSQSTGAGSLAGQTISP